MNSDNTQTRFTRRDFIKAASLAGGLLVAGGLGLRIAHDLSGRDFRVEQSAAWLERLRLTPHPEELPNILLVNADDLGYGDLGCYGSQAIRTPNLDRLADQGARLKNFYSCSPLCSPSRAGLLTGRYPIRTHITMPLYAAGSHLDIAFKLGGVYSYGVRGVPEDEILLSEALQRRGYRTALLGKWHLGDPPASLPLQNGFDFFYGALFSNDDPPYAIYRDDRIEISAPADQSLLTPAFTHEAIRFIRQDRSRPFFLYYASPFPHDPPHASTDFRGRSGAGTYGDAIEELDWSVGEMLTTLEEQGVAQNTLVIFTSDNGPWWEGSPGGLRGRKNMVFEGGLRVPMIARFPGVIPSGQVLDGVALNLDFFPTFLALAGIPLPEDRIIDGRDLLPTLNGEAAATHSEIYYYKSRTLLAMRSGDWKYIRRHMTDLGSYPTLRQGPFLFDLSTDPNESYDVSASHPDVCAEMIERMAEWEAQIEINRRGWL